MTYPTIMPALTLDFQNSQQLDPRVTFSRSSGATYINSAGSVVSAADHEPRFDHDPVTGECLGLLLEESRTNFVYPSIVPSSNSGAWRIDGAAVTTNAGTAPDGTNTASLVEEASGTGANRAYFFTGGIARDEVYSFFIKASSPDAVFSFTFTGQYAPIGTVEYTFSTGTISGSFPNDVSVEPYPNGWVRLSTTSFQGTTLSTSSYVRIQDFTGDFFIWGVQREVGTFPTSYIPTAGSAVTRSADIAQITGDNFSSWYNDSEATIVSTQIDADRGTGYGVVWGFGTGGTNRIELRQRSQEFRRGFYINGPSGGNISAVPLVYTKTSHAQQYTVGVAINASGADYAAEGVGVAGNTFTNATMPVIGTLYLSLGTVVDIASKTIARLSYYNERLTDAELQTLTS